MANPTKLLARRVRDGLIEFIFPPICVHCGRVGSYLCPICQTHEVPTLTRPLPQLEHIDGLTAVAHHGGAVQSAIHALKYDGVREVAAIMGTWLAACIPSKWQFEVIVPVPLHFSRLQTRGYNQATLIARSVARQLQVPVKEEALIRTHQTQTQVGLDAAERRDNVRGAFAAAFSIPPSGVLLIDDVCTTGSTLQAAAVALKEAHVQLVYAATLSYA